MIHSETKLRPLGITNYARAFPNIGGEANPPNTYYYAVDDRSWLIITICVLIGIIIVFGCFLQAYAYWHSREYLVNKIIK
jgi:hypothetical protein